MSALRRVLLEAPPQFDLRGGLGAGLLCVLISAWLHLVFFIVWQHLDGPAGERFYFNLENEIPAIELTLSVDEAIPLGEFLGTALEDPAAEEEYIESARLSDNSGEAEITITPPEASQEAAIDPAAPLEDQAGAAPEAVANPDPPLAVEAEAPAFKSYYTAIRRAINQRWVLPPEAKNQFRPSRLTCDFTIARDGALLRIVVIESSGSATLDHAGLEALRAAAPFPPFSEDLAAFSQLDIRMQFDYQARYISRDKP